MAKKGNKQRKDVKTVAENDAGCSKSNMDANPGSSTEDAPKKGTKRASTSTAKEETSGKRKKHGVEENGFPEVSARPKRATAAKAEQEVKVLFIKKRSGAKKGAAKTAAPRKEPAQFEVESIIASRKRKGRLEYKIRWKGYSHSADSWEPALHLSCPKVLDAWNAAQQNAEKSE